MIRAAEREEIHIFTSAITLTEVIKLKGKPSLKAEQEQKINRFFLNPYIQVVNVDRFLAQMARALIWEHGLHPKDSLHVATAIRFKIPYLDCYDGPMTALSGKLGNPPLKIGPPAMPQKEFDFAGSEETDGEED